MKRNIARDFKEGEYNMFQKFKLHPLQEERLEVEEWYRKERDNLDNLQNEKLKAIQNKCTHQWEDGKSAWSYTSPPFSETYCAICNKF